MANKQLTATVRFNTTQAEQSINRLVRKINTINNALNNTTSNKMEDQLNRSNNKLREIVNKVKSWSNNQKSVNSGIRSSNSLLKSVSSKLKSIAATYLGIMGTKALINTTDTITSAENKLNYVNAQNLGGAGVNSNGSYSTATFKATQDAMDKMYASSQKVRMGYDDMMRNVSKSMALAGDAFQNNTDNAIRFQEIMAEAYAVGGASAQEMSTSMYQMIQALGAGTLAGDELRSVREGAPLAYKAIEEFVQGVYDSEESLKDLASQGKVTSDMVVAAIMNASSEMDSAFAQTEQTFDQTWNQIKNAAVYAFKPVANSLRKALNNAIDNGLLTKIETLFVNVSKVLQIMFKLISNGIAWIADNWSWLSDILISGLITFGVLMVASGIKAIVIWTILNWKLILITLAIFDIIWALYSWQKGTITTTELIMACLGIISVGLMVLGMVFHSVTMFVIGLVLGAVLLVAKQAQTLCDFICNISITLAKAIIGILMVVLAVYIATGTVMLSVPVLIALAIIAVIALVAYIFFQYTEEVMGCLYAAGAFAYNFITGILDSIIQAFFSIFVEPVAGIIEWFVNAWNGSFTSVGGAFANFCGQLLSGLIGLIKPFAKLLDKVFGWDVNGAIESAQSSMKSWGKTEGAVTYTVTAPTVKSIASSLGFDLPDRFSYADSYNKGAAKGAEIRDKINSAKNKINSLGDSIKPDLDKIGDKFNLDNIGKALGLNFDDLTGANGSGFPNANDPAYDLTGAYKQPSNDDLLKGVKGTEDNTGRMADAMELSQEDLEYLRKIAEMEWKKEYTTANITVDMSNYNTINSENDLDGIVTKLTDKLYEEMNSLANGVYA